MTPVQQVQQDKDSVQLSTLEMWLKNSNFVKTWVTSCFPCFVTPDKKSSPQNSLPCQLHKFFAAIDMRGDQQVLDLKRMRMGTNPSSHELNGKLFGAGAASFYSLSLHLMQIVRINHLKHKNVIFSMKDLILIQPLRINSTFVSDTILYVETQP